MNRLWGALRNRLFITLLGLAALLVLIWYGGPLLALGDWLPLQSARSRWLTMAICVGLWMAHQLRLQLRVRHADRAFIQKPVPAADPDARRRDEELDQLDNRFDQALEKLRAQNRGRGGVGIYELPWYIIIGPPGSGKTTALVNSGLRFPLESEFGRESVRGVGGTRNCDWWFTDEAVLIDTAGRYTTQDSHREVDRAAWEGFLQLLKKHRRRQPINGALVAVSVADLQQQSAAERQAHTAAIRQRLHELYQQLGVRFPVYVMFTKADLISGFAEFFADMTPAEREQVWGFTQPLALSEAGGFDEQTMRAELDALIERLNQRARLRLHSEPLTERRPAIFAFPQQVASLREPLLEFLREVFQPDRYHGTTFLRGVYLSSATQTGAPFDRVLASVSRAFGIDPQALSSHPREGRSYFVRQVFKPLIFDEAFLAGTNARLERHRLWLQRGAYGGAVALTIATALAWAASFTRNEVQAHRFDSALDELERSQIAAPAPANDFKAVLERLNTVYQVVAVYPEAFPDGPPLSMRLGLYQGERLTRAAARYYHDSLETLLLPPIQARMEVLLERPVQDPDLYYETLKAYLMLGRPERRDRDLLQLWASYDWEQHSLAEQPQAQGQLGTHLEHLLADDFSAATLDPELVREARSQLQQAPLAELLYGRLKRDFAARNPGELSVIEIAGQAGRELFTRASGAPLERGVPKAFTAPAYREFFKPQLETVADVARAEAWVLSDERETLTGPEVEALQQRIHNLYLVEYIQRWDEFLTDLAIVPYNNLPHAAQLLGLATQTTSPLRGLLNTVAEHTQLVERGVLEKAAARLSTGRLERVFNRADAAPPELVAHPEQVVDQHFAEFNKLFASAESTPAPIAELYELLGQLFEHFDALAAGLGDDVTALASGSGGDIIARVHRAAARQPEPIATWLQQFAQHSRQVTYSGARDQIQNQWRADVLPICERVVNGRYPFEPGSSRDISLADFSRLLGPGGALDNFFQQHLQPFVTIDNGRWSWRKDGDLKVGFADATLAQFQRAATLRQMFFPAGGAAPKVDFTLRPIYLDANVKRVDLDVAGQLFRYRHGPTVAQPASWPGPEPTQGVRLSFEDDSGARLATSVSGPWAWFRLLDQSRPQRAGDEALQITLKEQGRQARWELMPSSVTNPFSQNLMSRFRCPTSL